MTSFITDDGRAHDWCDALEEKKQSKGVGQLVEAEEVDEDDGGQTDVSSGRDSKDGTENCLKVEYFIDNFLSFDFCLLMA